METDAPHPHSYGEIKNKILNRKEESKKQKLQCYEKEAFELFYNNYKYYRKKFYGYQTSLRDGDETHLAAITSKAFKKEMEEKLIPKMKKDKLIQTGTPFLAGSVATFAGSKMLEGSDALCGLCETMQMISLPLVCIGLFMGCNYLLNSKQKSKMDVFSKYLVRKNAEIMIDRCEKRYLVEKDSVKKTTKNNNKFSYQQKL